MAAAGSYIFRAEPQAVIHRAKFRNPDMEMDYGKHNIMYDRRVVRGNTYAAQVPTLAQQRAADATANEYHRKARAAAARRERFRATGGRRSRGANDMSSTFGHTTMHAGLGGLGAFEVERQHMTVQTDDYLEELVDKVFEAEAGTQTEEIDDGEVPPLYVPKPKGRDCGTMVEPGELFDYDLSVEPILEVLVGKCLDEGLTEVLGEEELKMLRRHREAFEHKRNAELAEVQLLQAASQRRFEEKERRLKQERDRLLREKIVAQKVAARTTAKNYLAGLSNTILDRLEQSGHFYDPVLRQVEGNFIPYLEDLVANKLADVHNARLHVDNLVQSAIEKVMFKWSEEERVEREAAQEKKRLEEAHLAQVARVEKEIAEEEEDLRLKAEAAAAAARLAEEERQRLEALEMEEEFDEDGNYIERYDEDGNLIPRRVRDEEDEDGPGVDDEGDQSTDEF